MRTLKRFLALAPVVCVSLCVPSLALASQKRHIPLTDVQIKAQVEHKVSELDLGTGQVLIRL